MGEVERTILREKLRLLAGYVAVIRARLPASAEELHVGTAEGRRAPDDAREAIRDLGSLGVTPRDLAERLAPPPGCAT